MVFIRCMLMVLGIHYQYQSSSSNARSGGTLGHPEDQRFISAYLFSGLLCHLDDACVSNPCHEDAICDTNPVSGRAICTCPPGFTGGACDQDVDECSIGEKSTFWKGA
jgi:hypothetical protein